MSDNTDLMKYAIEGNTAMVAAYLPYEAGLRNKYGFTALMFAVLNGNKECVKLLAPHEMELRDNDGTSALMYAMKFAKEIIDNIAHKRLYFCNGSLYYDTNIAKQNYFDMIKYLVPNDKKNLQDKDGKTALMYAAYYNNPECIKLIIDKEVGLQDNKEKTALMYAAENGYSECVKLLLPHEKDIRDNEDKLAKDYAKDADILALFQE